MPTPTYISVVNGEAALILNIDDPAAGDTQYIAWDDLPTDQQANLLDNLFDRIDDVSAITAATGIGPFPGFQHIQFAATPTVGATLTLLEATRTYNFAAEVDGVPLAGSFLGSAAVDFTALLVEINTILGAAATASLILAGPFVDHILIESATTGSASFVKVTDSNVFVNIDGFVRELGAVNGGADLFEVADLTERTPDSPWRTLFSLGSFGPSAAPAKGVLKADLIAGSPSPVGSDGNWIYVPDQVPPTYVFSDGIDWIDIRTGVALA